MMPHFIMLYTGITKCIVKKCRESYSLAQCVYHMYAYHFMLSANFGNSLIKLVKKDLMLLAVNTCF